MDDVQDLAKSVGANGIAARGLLHALDLGDLRLELVDSVLDPFTEINESLSLLRLAGRALLDSVGNSLRQAFKVSGLDSVSVQQDRLLGLNGLDALESLDVSSSA